MAKGFAERLGKAILWAAVSPVPMLLLPRDPRAGSSEMLFVYALYAAPSLIVGIWNSWHRTGWISSLVGIVITVIAYTISVSIVGWLWVGDAGVVAVETRAAVYCISTLIASVFGVGSSWLLQRALSDKGDGN